MWFVSVLLLCFSGNAFADQISLGINCSRTSCEFALVPAPETIWIVQNSDRQMPGEFAVPGVVADFELGAFNFSLNPGSDFLLLLKGIAGAPGRMAFGAASGPATAAAEGKQ